MRRYFAPHDSRGRSPSSSSQSWPGEPPGGRRGGGGPFGALVTGALAFGEVLAMTVEAGAARSGLYLDQLIGGATEVHSHPQIAAAIAYGLGFVPLTEERFDLTVTPALAQGPEIAALVGLLAWPSLRSQLANIAGYDSSTCGARIDASLDAGTAS